jgi:hypothetical protein
MSLKKILLSGVAALAMAASAKAATITYTLSLNDQNGVPTVGRYSVYAEITGGSQGLAAFQVNVTGVTSPGSGTNIATSTGVNASPRGTYSDSGGNLEPETTGFTSNRAAQSTGTNAMEFRGSQDTTNFASGTVDLLDNIGISASSLDSQRPSGYDTSTSGTGTPSSWASKVLLATGAIPVGQTPAFSTVLPTAGNVFTDISTATTQAATIVTQVVNAPEPASLGLLGVAGLVLARRRRIA